MLAVPLRNASAMCRRHGHGLLHPLHLLSVNSALSHAFSFPLPLPTVRCLGVTAKTILRDFRDDIRQHFSANPISGALSRSCCSTGCRKPSAASKSLTTFHGVAARRAGDSGLSTPGRNIANGTVGSSRSSPEAYSEDRPSRPRRTQGNGSGPWRSASRFPCVL